MRKIMACCFIQLFWESELYVVCEIFCNSKDPEIGYAAIWKACTFFFGISKLIKNIQTAACYEQGDLSIWAEGNKQAQR